MFSPREKRTLHRLLEGKKDERLAIVFNALGEETRCKIFRLILKKEGLSVGEIAAAVGISMSSASQHLKILELTGLLERRRMGKEVHFSPQRSDRLVRTIIQAVEK